MIYEWRFNDKTDLLKYIDKLDSEKKDSLNPKGLLKYIDKLDSEKKDSLNEGYYDYLEKKMDSLNPKGYYDYLEKKMDKNNVESYILKYKNFDKKFAKQLDNIDPNYFVENPKDLIFVYFILEPLAGLEPATPRYGFFLGTFVFYDIQTISRIFRKFDDSKGRFKSCDEENKSLRNIIIYSGNTHTQNINKFLSKLPGLRLLSEPIPRILFGKHILKKWIPNRFLQNYPLVNLDYMMVQNSNSQRILIILDIIEKSLIN